MQSAPICVSEMMSSVTLVLNYQLSNADWKCSRDFLERIRSKMSQFLEEQCTDVGWTYSGADMANVSKLGLNFTTHNRDTPAVLGCIDSITGHVPLIPPPCPNSGVRRNTTKYHLRCPTGWGANNRLRCEKCPPGYHVDNESCAPCPRGTYNVNPEFTDCIACPEGQTTLSDAAMGEHMCVAQCPPGFFSRRSGLAPCSPCPQGTYQPDSGQEGCLSCGVGLTTTELGTQDVNDCRSQCLSGFYSPYGVEPCEPCPIAHYNEEEGSVICHRCPAGFTTASIGSTGPNECRVSSCSSAGCSNRGECLGDICKCEIGFSGNICDVPLNLCNASFCLNNGVCNFNENDGSFCTCSEGFNGRRCEIDMAKMTHRFKRKATRWSSSSSQSWHQSSWFNSSSTGEVEPPDIRFAPTTRAKTTFIPRTTNRHPPTVTTHIPFVTTETFATTLGTTNHPTITISASSQSSIDGHCKLNHCSDGKCGSENTFCDCNDGFKLDTFTLKKCIPDKSCHNLGICVKKNTKTDIGDWDTDQCCVCLDGYHGKYCEIEPKQEECCNQNADCTDGKTCLFDTNSNCGHCYEQCDGNHYLKSCTRPSYNKFNETKCKNGGKLAYLEDKHMVYCDCQGDGNEMYIGEYCDHRLSRCHKEHTSRLICENAGRCRDDGIHSYCECPEGFTGERCETMIDFCDAAKKDGTCVAEHTIEYIPHHLSCYCYCKEGYFNETCADEIDPCEARGKDVCGNGVCKSDGPGYAAQHECVCNGKNLLSEDRCLSWKSPCDDNTSCDKRCKVKSHNETVCACRDGYYGATCDPIDYCLPGVCLNDGICHQGVDINKNPWMKCECREGSGASGENCEKLTSCNNISCGDNGTCVQQGDRHHCECSGGYSGSMCEKPERKCIESRDYSAGTCIHGTCNSETDICECDPGYTGESCNTTNKNGFNLYFTGEPTDTVKGEVTIEGERKGPRFVTSTAWLRFEDDVIGNESVKMTPITVKLDKNAVLAISNNEIIWNGAERLSYKDCNLKGWNYYVTSYDSEKRFLKVIINNQFVYQKDKVTIGSAGAWSIVLGRQPQDDDFFRGEVGLVQLHSNSFSADEIKRHIENCTENQFNADNIIVKWNDLKLMGWQRNDVQVIVPGICAHSKCEGSAADCSPDRDRFPPLPRNCPSIIRRSTDKRLVQISWDTTDMFTDDNPIVRISSNYAPNQAFTWGYYHVVYIAVDVKGNIGRCEFDVIVGNSNLTDPYEIDVRAVKKQVESDEILEYAKLQCEEDKNFLKEISPFYTKDVLHRWSRFEEAPLSSFPSCVATTNPEQNVTGGLTWIRGDCKESERIKREIIESLNEASIQFKKEHDLDEGFCPEDDCESITSIDDSCEGLRLGRNVEAELSAEKITYKYHLSVSNTKYIVRPFINITLHESFNDSSTYDPTYPKQNFACEVSFPFVRRVENVTEIHDLQFCTDWPAGSYFQAGMNESAPCPVNKCQPKSAQKECVDCPGGRITMDVGCKNETAECYFPCPVGQYGTYNGCFPCPIGFYNPIANSSSCAKCASDQSTNHTGADNIKFCFHKCADRAGQVLGEDDECHDCQQGTFKKENRCQSCNPGFTTRTSAADSEAECCVVHCPKGYTLKDKYIESFNNITDPNPKVTTYCAPCDRFSYKDVPGNDKCQKCPKGNSTNGEGSTAVTACTLLACNPGLTDECPGDKKCTQSGGKDGPFICQYPNLHKSREENWLLLMLLGFFLLNLVLLLILFISNKRQLLRYIDATCPWLLFCWIRKEGNRRFSVNPTRDTSNLPFSPNTQNSDEMENTSTTALSQTNELDSASAIESLPSEEGWLKKRTTPAATLDPLTEIRSNLMHVMTSATSAVSSDSSGKRTPPPIQTGSPSRRDMEAAKAAARLARSETYQMATFGQTSPVQSPRVKVEAGIIRHHRTVGPTMVEARPLRVPQFMPRINPIQPPTPRLMRTAEEDDEEFFC